MALELNRRCAVHCFGTDASFLPWLVSEWIVAGQWIRKIVGLLLHLSQHLSLHLPLLLAASPVMVFPAGQQRVDWMG